MKKGCAYILLIAVLLQVTPAVQLLKIPVLLEHFSEHQHRNPGISFFAFLEMHYWGQDLPDDDTDRDMELPFKKPADQSFQIQGACVCAPDVILTQRIDWGDSPDYQVLPQSMLPAAFKGSLFKPPRA